MGAQDWSLELRGDDSSLSGETPEGIEFVLHPAGLPARACAYVIDELIQYFVCAGVLAGLQFVSFTLGMWVVLLVLFCITWFYHVLFEVFGGGQSIGKRILGLRVVRGDGSPVDPASSFLRNLLRFADTFFFLCIIAFVCMSFSRGFRRIGDWAADTLVVYSSGGGADDALRGVTMPWAAEAPPAAVSRPLSYEEKQAILMFAARYPLLGRARADEIAGNYAASLRGDGASGGAASATGVSDSEFLLGLAGRSSGEPV